MFKILKLIHRIFIPQGPPLQFIFFITSRCNLHCKHCFYLDNLNKYNNDLSLEEIDKMTRGTGNLLWVALTGGEPFLRHDIADIVEIFHRNTNFYLLTISTNGLQTQDTINAVRKMCQKTNNAHILIYTSLDGLEETHEKIRGASGIFKKSLRTIAELKELKAEFSNLGVGTITTINAQNQSEMKDLALFIKNEIKPDTMTINMLRGKPRTTQLGKIELKNYFDFINVQQEGWISGDLGYFNIFAKTIVQKREMRQKKIISSIFNTNKYVIPCQAAHISCIMNEKGDLYPCEILDMKIGNIRKAGYDFKKLWHSPKAVEARKFIKNTQCHCTYECALTTNILFNPKELIKMMFQKSTGIG
jgi:radical SAM protein with 4Fe4S-binding SPASM domain